MARPTKPKDIKPKAEGDVATLPVGGGEGAAGGGGGGGGLDLKFIITLVVVVLSTTLTSAASIYFLAPMVVMPPLEKQLKEMSKGAAHGAEAEGEGEHGNADSHANDPGMNLELDEFTVNLKSDPEMDGSQYLRAKMSLGITVPPEENCYNLGGAEHHASAMPEVSPSRGRIVGAAANIANTNATTNRDARRPIDRSQVANGGGGPDPKTLCVTAFKDNMSKFVPTVRDVVNAALMKRTAGALSTLEGQESLKDEIKESINQFMGEKYQVARVNFEDFIIQK